MVPGLPEERRATTCETHEHQLPQPTASETAAAVSRLGRAYRRWSARESAPQRAMLTAAYYLFIVLPYPLRRVAVAGYIFVVLWLKRRLGIEERDELTPLDEAGTLSFWRVPEVDRETYTLTIDGAVEAPVILPLDDVLAMPSAARRVRMDCVGGFRNNIDMRGVRFADLMARVRPRAGARRAIFYCADGYFESSTLADLDAAETLLVYEVNGESVAHLGAPLRVAIPGKYGYKWAKWVQRIEIVTHDRKGYWPQRGLPDRANVGDLW